MQMCCGLSRINQTGSPATFTTPHILPSITTHTAKQTLTALGEGLSSVYSLLCKTNVRGASPQLVGFSLRYMGVTDCVIVGKSVQVGLAKPVLIKLSQRGGMELATNVAFASDCEPD